MKVGVIGLGSMGMGAALNLLKSQHQVVGCELREAARAEIATAGGSAVASAAERSVRITRTSLALVQQRNHRVNARGELQRSASGSALGDNPEETIATPHGHVNHPVISHRK